MKGQDSDKQQLLSEEDNDDGLGHHVSQTRRRRSCATLTTLLLCSTVLLAVTSVGLAVALYKTSQAKIFSHRHPSPVPPSESVLISPTALLLTRSHISASNDHNVRRALPLRRPLNPRKRPRMGGNDASKFAIWQRRSLLPNIHSVATALSNSPTQPPSTFPRASLAATANKFTTSPSSTNCIA